MAKKKRPTRTLTDLLNVDINKLTKETIKEYTRVARENVRKTVARWDKKEYKSPAYYALSKRTDGKMKISFRGLKTLQKQKEELAKAIRFLSDESRTVEGWERIKRENVNALNERLLKEQAGTYGPPIQLTTDDYDRFYSIYEKAKEMDKNIASMEYKYEVMETIVSKVKNTSKSVDELAVEVKKEFEELYKNRERQHKKNMDDVSEEFN